MADFYVNFGSNAKDFAAKLEAELASARKSIRELREIATFAGEAGAKAATTPTRSKARNKKDAGGPAESAQAPAGSFKLAGLAELDSALTKAALQVSGFSEDFGAIAKQLTAASSSAKHVAESLASTLRRLSQSVGVREANAAAEAAGRRQIMRHHTVPGVGAKLVTAAEAQRLRQQGAQVTETVRGSRRNPILEAGKAAEIRATEAEVSAQTVTITGTPQLLVDDAILNRIAKATEDTAQGVRRLIQRGVGPQEPAERGPRRARRARREAEDADEELEVTPRARGRRRRPRLGRPTYAAYTEEQEALFSQEQVVRHQLRQRRRLAALQAEKARAQAKPGGKPTEDERKLYEAGSSAFKRNRPGAEGFDLEKHVDLLGKAIESVTKNLGTVAGEAIDVLEARLAQASAAREAAGLPTHRQRIAPATPPTEPEPEAVRSSRRKGRRAAVSKQAEATYTEEQEALFTQEAVLRNQLRQRRRLAALQAEIARAQAKPTGAPSAEARKAYEAGSKGFAANRPGSGSFDLEKHLELLGKAVASVTKNLGAVAGESIDAIEARLAEATAAREEAGLPEKRERKRPKEEAAADKLEQAADSVAEAADELDDAAKRQARIQSQRLAKRAGIVTRASDIDLAEDMGSLEQSFRGRKTNLEDLRRISRSFAAEGYEAFFEGITDRTTGKELLQRIGQAREEYEKSGFATRTGKGGPIALTDRDEGRLPERVDPKLQRMLRGVIAARRLTDSEQRLADASIRNLKTGGEVPTARRALPTGQRDFGQSAVPVASIEASLRRVLGGAAVKPQTKTRQIGEDRPLGPPAPIEWEDIAGADLAREMRLARIDATAFATAFAQARDAAFDPYAAEELIEGYGDQAAAARGALKSLQMATDKMDELGAQAEEAAARFASAQEELDRLKGARGGRGLKQEDLKKYGEIQGRLETWKPAVEARAEFLTPERIAGRAARMASREALQQRREAVKAKVMESKMDAFAVQGGLEDFLFRSRGNVGRLVRDVRPPTARRQSDFDEEGYRLFKKASAAQQQLGRLQRDPAVTMESDEFKAALEKSIVSLNRFFRRLDQITPGGLQAVSGDDKGKKVSTRIDPARFESRTEIAYSPGMREHASAEDLKAVQRARSRANTQRRRHAEQGAVIDPALFQQTEETLVEFNQAIEEKVSRSQQVLQNAVRAVERLPEIQAAIASLDEQSAALEELRTPELEAQLKGRGVARRRELKRDELLEALGKKEVGGTTAQQRAEMRKPQLQALAREAKIPTSVTMSRQDMLAALREPIQQLRRVQERALSQVQKPIEQAQGRFGSGQGWTGFGEAEQATARAAINAEQLAAASEGLMKFGVNLQEEGNEALAGAQTLNELVDRLRAAISQSTLVLSAIGRHGTTGAMSFLTKMQGAEKGRKTLALGPLSDLPLPGSPAWQARFETAKVKGKRGRAEDEVAARTPAQERQLQRARGVLGGTEQGGSAEMNRLRYALGRMIGAAVDDADKAVKKAARREIRTADFASLVQQAEAALGAAAETAEVIAQAVAGAKSAQEGGDKSGFEQCCDRIVAAINRLGDLMARGIPVKGMVTADAARILRGQPRLTDVEKASREARRQRVAESRDEDVAGGLSWEERQARRARREVFRSVPAPSAAELRAMQRAATRGSTEGMEGTGAATDRNAEREVDERRRQSDARARAREGWAQARFEDERARREAPPRTGAMFDLSRNQVRARRSQIEDLARARRTERGEDRGLSWEERMARQSRRETLRAAPDPSQQRIRAMEAERRRADRVAVAHRRDTEKAAAAATAAKTRQVGNDAFAAERAARDARTQASATTRVTQTLEASSDAARAAVAELERLSRARASDAEITRAQANAYALLERDMQAQTRVSASGRNVPIHGSATRRTNIGEVLGAATGAPIGGAELTEIKKRAALSATQFMDATTTAGQAEVGRRGGFFQMMGSMLFGRSGGGDATGGAALVGRMFASTGTFIVRNFTAGLVFGLTNAMQELMRQAMESEAAFIRIQDAFEATGRSADGLRRQLQDVAVQYGIGLDEAYNYAAALSGIMSPFRTTGQVAAGVELVAQLELISNGALSGQEAVGALNSVVTAFSANLEQAGLTGAAAFQHVGDVATYLQNQMAVNIEDTVEGVGRISAQADVMGLSWEQSAVYVAAIAKLTNQTGTAAGEQMQRILSTLESSAGLAAVTRELTAAQATGAVPQGTANQMIDMAQQREYGDVLTLLIQNWDNLGDAAQSNIARALGGARQAAAVAALFSRGAELIELTTGAMNANGEAAERAEKRMKTLDAQLRRMGANFASLADNLMQLGLLNIFGLFLKGLNATLTMVNNLLQAFNGFTDENPLFAFLKKAAGAGLGLLAVMKLLKVASRWSAEYIGKRSVEQGIQPPTWVRRRWQPTADQQMPKGFTYDPVKERGRLGQAFAGRLDALGGRYGSIEGPPGGRFRPREATRDGRILHAPTAFPLGRAPTPGADRFLLTAPVRALGRASNAVGTSLLGIGQAASRAGLQMQTTGQGFTRLTGGLLSVSGAAAQGTGRLLMFMRPLMGLSSVLGMVERRFGIFAATLQIQAAGLATRGGLAGGAGALLSRGAAGAASGVSRLAGATAGMQLGSVAGASAAGLFQAALAMVVIEMQRAKRFAEDLGKAFDKALGRKPLDEDAVGTTQAGSEVERLIEESRKHSTTFWGSFSRHWVQGMREVGNRALPWRPFQTAAQAAGEVPEERMQGFTDEFLTHSQNLRAVAANAGTGADAMAEIQEAGNQSLKDIRARIAEVEADASLSDAEKATALAYLERTRKGIENQTASLAASARGISGLNAYTADQLSGIFGMVSNLSGLSNRTVSQQADLITMMISDLALPNEDVILGEIEKMRAGQSGSERAGSMKTIYEAALEGIMARLPTLELDERLKFMELAKQGLTGLDQAAAAAIDEVVTEASALAELLQSGGNYQQAAASLDSAIAVLRQRYNEVIGAAAKAVVMNQIRETQLKQTRIEIEGATAELQLRKDMATDSMTGAQLELEIAQQTLAALEHAGSGASVEEIRQAQGRVAQARNQNAQLMFQYAAAIRQTAMASIRDPMRRAYAELADAYASQAEQLGRDRIQDQANAQAVIRARMQVEDQAAELARARAEYAIGGLAVGADMARAVATLREAERRLSAARNMGLGEAAELAILGEIRDRTREIDDMLHRRATARADLAIAIARAGGHDVEASRLELERAQGELARSLQRSGGEESEEVLRARASVISATASLRDVTFSTTLDTMDFQREMGEITANEAIRQLQNMLTQADLTEAQRRDLRRRIRQLQGDLRSALTESGFNIPTDIRMPTAYEVRRSLGLEDFVRTGTRTLTDVAQLRDGLASQPMSAPGVYARTVEYDATEALRQLLDLNVSQRGGMEALTRQDIQVTNNNEFNQSVATPAQVQQIARAVVEILGQQFETAVRATAPVARTGV